MPSLAARFPCCRAHDLFHPLEEAPLLLKRNPAGEVYWLKWDHAFGAAATIRIARLGEEVMAAWQHRGATFTKRRSRSARLLMSDWSLLEDAEGHRDFPREAGEVTRSSFRVTL